MWLVVCVCVGVCVWSGSLPCLKLLSGFGLLDFSEQHGYTVHGQSHLEVIMWGGELVATLKSITVARMVVDFLKLPESMLYRSHARAVDSCRGWHVEAAPSSWGAV